MLVNVKALDGTVHQVTAAEGAGTTVAALKRAVEAATAIPAPEMRLIFRGKVLADDKTLADYAMEDGFTVLLLRKPRTPPSSRRPLPSSRRRRSPSQSSPSPSSPSSRHRCCHPVCSRRALRRTR